MKPKMWWLTRGAVVVHFVSVMAALWYGYQLVRVLGGPAFGLYVALIWAYTADVVFRRAQRVAAERNALMQHDDDRRRRFVDREMAAELARAEREARKYYEDAIAERVKGDSR